MTLMCCKIGCKQEATWCIDFGDGPDDYTHSCSDCMPEMLKVFDFPYIHTYQLDRPPLVVSFANGQWIL